MSHEQGSHARFLYLTVLVYMGCVSTHCFSILTPHVVLCLATACHGDPGLWTVTKFFSFQMLLACKHSASINLHANTELRG